MPIRRVVTGTDRRGKSVFVSDGPAEATTLSMMPGFEFTSLWGADEVVSLPFDGTRPDAPAYFPPTGGFRFGFVTIPPETTRPPTDTDLGRGLAELEEKLPGLAAHMEPDNPGMHTTDTVDLDLVVSGEVTLELDDGAAVHLEAGDCVVQNGTRHAWRNRSSAPCVLAVAIVGATRAVD